MSLIKKMSEEDKERFEIFSRLPNEEKVKLIMKYQKRIDMAINRLENSAMNKGICTQPNTDTIQTVLMILRGDSDD